MAAHRVALTELILVTNRPDSFRHLGVPIISDVFPGAGPLAGIHAALQWARGEGAAGICCTPCDAPFANPALLSMLVEASREPAVLAVLPESTGPLGYEPLFAWYSIETLPVLTARLEAGKTAVHTFIESLERKALLPLPRIQSIGEPEVLFLNVNTPADLERAREALSIADPGTPRAVPSGGDHSVEG